MHTSSTALSQDSKISFIFHHGSEKWQNMSLMKIESSPYPAFYHITVKDKYMVLPFLFFCW